MAAVVIIGLVTAVVSLTMLLRRQDKIIDNLKQELTKKARKKKDAK